MSFIDEVKNKARKNIKTIILTESEDKRVLKTIHIDTIRRNKFILSHIAPRNHGKAKAVRQGKVLPSEGKLSGKPGQKRTKLSL